MFVLNGEVVTAERYQAAGEVERQALRWNALVQAYDAAAGFQQLLGATWTGRVAQVAV